MRIRSIRPEFWTSEDIAALDWDTRLIYIGLWSYVDDNGVGRDVPRLIASALFPLDEDTHGVLMKVQMALKRLDAGGQIVRYEVDSKAYLHVKAWTAHQVINRPSKGRYPLPTCEDAVPPVVAVNTHATLTEYSTPGEGEKGRRGEGEKGIPPTAGDAQTAQTLLAEWIDHCGDTPPPSRVKGQVSKELKGLLDDGIPYDAVRTGLAAWHDKGLHPSTLASVVHETRTAPTRRGKSTTDDRVQQALTLAAQLEAGEHNHHAIEGRAS